MKRHIASEGEFSMEGAVDSDDDDDDGEERAA
jgi:hypothetical protein